MKQAPTIRPARPEDQPALLAIVWATVMDSDSDREALLARPELVEVPVEHLAPATGVVVEIDGAPVGFATVLPRPDGEAELDGLFVLPERQRLGLGRALVAGAAELGRAMGARVLHVVANEDANAFYRAVGFVQTGMAPTALKPAPKMELRLGG
jgi:GNAT superfamily N-acetyltransferase